MRRAAGRARAWATGLALVLLAYLGPACGGGGSPDVRAVVLVVIDTLREDRLGCTGHPTASTPHLDALAARGVRFARAYTPVPVTLPAVSALLTGRYPFRNTVRDNEHYVLPAAEVTLAERFREAGWRTGAVLASAVLAADRGADQGFEEYDDRFAPPYAIHRPEFQPLAEELARTRRRADTVTDLAVERMRSFGGEPFFLFVHYFDVHAYYDPPPRFAALHPDHPYDGEISFVDAELGRLFAALPDPANTLVFVVSDHGEGLGEHGEPEHGFLLYESTLRVPILAAGPGIPAGLVREDPVSLIDVAPTIVRRAGLSADGPAVDGAALDLAGPEPRTTTLYAETMRPLVSYRWSELRAVVQDGRKLIEGPAPEMYDVNEDRAETRALALDDAADALRSELVRITGGETRADVLAALRGETNEERRELLQSLGYVGQAEDAAPRDGEYPNPRDALPRWLAEQRLKAVYREATSLAAAGRSDEAIARFDSVLTAGMVRADVYLNRGLARRDRGDRAGFRSDLDRALALDPEYVPARVQRAEAAERAGSSEEARAEWARILSLEPQNVSALRALAYGHLKAGEHAEALPYLRTLVGVRPDDPDARYNLGLAALQAGRTEEARLHLQEFLKLDPGSRNAGDVQRVLDQLGPR